MTETGVCLRHWNFSHWDLFVICYLYFGISINDQISNKLQAPITNDKNVGLFGTLGFLSLESENHKSQAPKTKQATNLNVQ